jgi:hypothetical protein
MNYERKMNVLEKETQSSHNFSPPQTFLQKFQPCTALTIKENHFWAEKQAFSISRHKLVLIQHFTKILSKKFRAAQVPEGFSYICRAMSDRP